jgi:hypothetical protein
MYAGGMPGFPGIPWDRLAATWAWLSSGESTGLLSSTPFASPLAGSGAFRQACGRVSNWCDWSGAQSDAQSVARWRGGPTYLDEILTLGFGDERLQFRGGEGVDKTGLGDDEQQHLGAGEDGQFVGLEGGRVSEERSAANVSHATRVNRRDAD